MQMSLFTPSEPKPVPAIVEPAPTPAPPDFADQALLLLSEAVPDFSWEIGKNLQYPCVLSVNTPVRMAVRFINGRVVLMVGVEHFVVDDPSEIGEIVSGIVAKLRGQWDRKVKVTTDGELVLDDPPVVAAGKGDFWSSPEAPTRAELVNLVTGSNYPADWLPDTAQSYAGCEVCGGWLEGIGGGMYITHPECIRAWYNVVLGAKMRFEEQAYRELAAEVGDKPKQTKKRAAP